MKNIIFLSENFQFLEAKFSIYLNRRVFVMFPISRCKILISVLFLDESFKSTNTCGFLIFPLKRLNSQLPRFSISRRKF